MPGVALAQEEGVDTLFDAITEGMCVCGLLLCLLL
jgi:hypothetical protein